jgi:hypothetical protein
MQNIEAYYQMVEGCIARLGVDPLVCRGEKPGMWSLKKGSADVWIDVWKVENDDYGYFQAMAPVCEIPANRTQEFLQEILEINHNLYGVGMTKYENWIYIKTIRELDGISEDEMFAMFNRIGNYADDYDDILRDKYFGGGRRSE